MTISDNTEADAATDRLCSLLIGSSITRRLPSGKVLRRRRTASIVNSPPLFLLNPGNIFFDFQGKVLAI
jgi:hypothetical protein